jgi:Hint domain
MRERWRQCVTCPFRTLSKLTAALGTVPIAGYDNCRGDIAVQRENLTSSRRTRRNLLAAGGLLAGAALSQLGTSKADAACTAAAVCRCFLRGTRLQTPDGERKIEDLRIGDLVTTLSGEANPITWIGRRVYRRSTDSRHPESVLPVRVARGALGRGTPQDDLLISQHHALLVDGVFIKAVDLVNGSSITLQSAAQASEIEYLHVKLARHDVILAEATPSETLLVHSGNVECFDNFAEYLRLFGEDATEEARCAPIAFGSRRERLMSRLRSAVSPWIDYRNEFDKARDRIEELAV